MFRGWWENYSAFLCHSGVVRTCAACTNQEAVTKDSFAFFCRMVSLLCAFSCAGWSEAVQEQRIPGQQPRQMLGALLGTAIDQDGLPVIGATITATNLPANKSFTAITNSEGIFRLRDLPPGQYEVKGTGIGYALNAPLTVTLGPGGIQQAQLTFQSTNPAAALPPGPSGIPGRNTTITPEIVASVYPGLRSPQPETLPSFATAEVIPPDSSVFSPKAYRWNVDMPEWNRYHKKGEFPYARSHWYDPFDRNRLKGDLPIFGKQWFFDFTGTSETGIDVRRLPVPSGVSAEQPRDYGFFGRGEQAFAAQTFFLSFDLSHGDSSFRPADFRARFTPAFNLNFLQTRERGLVNIDVSDGTNRFDTHPALQEGFVELKLHDLSPNFDFVSVRAGIQQFNSDFRGFVFSEQQPGVRLFGNLRSNRINYNLAYFYFLEKNTNSELNTFSPRQQQVYIGNVYVQDFLAKGYTTEFSFHYNRDDPTIHFDDNGFLVRPGPIGSVVNGAIKAHQIKAYYIGWTSNGHIGRLNVSHAFYQALGHDTFNTIAGRRVNIDGRLGAVELSVDKDWMRFRTSFLYQSGDGNNRSGASRTDDTAHGFDAIVNDTHFAGGVFSFFDNEGIRLTSTGIGLTNPSSLLVNLRTNKFEGQANFVNPGLFLYNVGADFNLKPKLRAFLNANYLRFDRTEPLQIVLFQNAIRHSIGTDVGVGVEYRPPLTENIVLTAGASALVPDIGFEQIFNNKTLPSGVLGLKFVF
jgi:Carboxypeptidase regulatory-like domain